MNESFPCTSCGECCKRVGSLLQSKQQQDVFTRFVINKFPYKANEKGWCEKLNEDNTCSVYDDRPLLCNIKAMAAARGVPWEYSYLLTAKICNHWILANPDLDNDKYLVFFEEK